MDIKWKKSKGVLGFLAFVVGLSLLLEGALYFGAAYSTSRGRRWIQDSFQQDFQNTQEFRDYICNRLELLITMGAGGNVYGDSQYSPDADPSDISATRGRIWALHESIKEDKNVLYSVGQIWKPEDLADIKIASSGTIYSMVDVEGETEYLYDVLYSNSDAMAPRSKPKDLPQGYNFLLHFDGAKVHAWKDGEELNLYGDGYYRYNDQGPNSNQWYVPGYENFTVDEAGSDVWVTMAVISEPQIFIKGNYGKSVTDQYNQLYYMKQNLADHQTEIVSHRIRAGVGAALFLLYLLLRKDKKRADLVLARCTGKIWFEVKLLAALLLALFCIPKTEYLGEVWQELTYAYTPQTAITQSDFGDAYLMNGDIAAQLEEQGINYEEWLSEYGISAETSIQQATSFGTVVSILQQNGGWLLREYLQELSNHIWSLVSLFWGLYLLLFNDWRYNRRPWRRGVIALLCAGELKYPLQRRLRRQNRRLALAFTLLSIMVFYFLYNILDSMAWIPLRWLAIITPLIALALFLGVWTLVQQWRLWNDFGAVADQAAAVRAGELEKELALQPSSDLAGLADDLNHIRQGLYQAVEERTQSERMKVELVTNVSHDLKTPLTSIISYTELLSQEPLEPPASEYVTILGEKAQRLKVMVQDVFEVTKAASGQLPVKLEKLDYARLLRQTLADMAQAIADSGLTLRTSIPDKEFPIIADSERLYRVFQNLISNALKYSLPGSRVYLTLSAGDNETIACIQNTSATELKPGIDYTARFVRGDESRSDGGSGLGLSIAQSFTQACGGTLTITTEADLFTAIVSFPFLP